jgi:hypothetical protein
MWATQRGSASPSQVQVYEYGSFDAFTELSLPSAQVK